MRTPVNTRAIAYMVNYLTTFIYNIYIDLYYHEKFSTHQ